MPERPPVTRRSVAPVRAHRLGRLQLIGAGVAGLGFGALGLGAVLAQEAIPVSELGPIPGTTRYDEPPVRASPRGMAWDAGGALDVAQAGTGETAASAGPAKSQ